MQGVNGERRFALRSSATAVAAASEENQSITSGPHLRLLPPSASLGHSNPRIPGPFYCLPADITDALVSGRVTSAISRRRDFGCSRPLRAPRTSLPNREVSAVVLSCQINAPPAGRSAGLHPWELDRPQVAADTPAILLRKKRFNEYTARFFCSAGCRT
jgi:hypothetical protein